MNGLFTKKPLKQRDGRLHSYRVIILQKGEMRLPSSTGGKIAKQIEDATENLRARAADRRVFTLMSGGVDSSVAVMLALRAGLDTTGVTMRQLDDDSSVYAAGQLCGNLGVERLVFDLRREFTELVIDPFRAAYMRGETPNPCAMCNPSVKFGLLWKKIAEYCGRDDFYVVTGHYARTEPRDGEIALLRGVDRNKDQSYFLCMLPSSRVNRLLFPLGNWTKAETREIARELGAPVPAMRRIAEKPESMEICFMQEGDYRSLLRGAGRSGPILNRQGEQLGKHDGIENFTVGQRKGLGLTSREPLFVTEIRPGENAVVVASREDAMTREIRATRVNILTPDACYSGAVLQGKIRSQSYPAPCRIEIHGGDRVKAVFDEPQFAPAPGQYLVLYDGERLVVGGCIERAE